MTKATQNKEIERVAEKANLANKCNQFGDKTIHDKAKTNVDRQMEKHPGFFWK